MAGIKWRPQLTTEESLFLAQIPKATLFVVARQLAAVMSGHCDNLGADALRVLMDEWYAQYGANNVPQRPPNWMCRRP